MPIERLNFTLIPAIGRIRAASLCGVLRSVIRDQKPRPDNLQRLV